MADGLRVEHLGRLPFMHLRRYMDEIVTVSEEQMVDAIRRLATGARLVVEPSGAAAMAAHLVRRRAAAARRRPSRGRHQRRQHRSARAGGVPVSLNGTGPMTPPRVIAGDDGRCCWSWRPAAAARRPARSRAAAGALPSRSTTWPSRVPCELAMVGARAARPGRPGQRRRLPRHAGRRRCLAVQCQETPRPAPSRPRTSALAPWRSS